MFIEFLIFKVIFVLSVDIVYFPFLVFFSIYSNTYSVFFYSDTKLSFLLALHF